MPLDIKKEFSLPKGAEFANLLRSLLPDRVANLEPQMDRIEAKIDKLLDLLTAAESLARAREGK